MSKKKRKKELTNNGFPNPSELEILRNTIGDDAPRYLQFFEKRMEEKNGLPNGPHIKRMNCIDLRSLWNTRTLNLLLNAGTPRPKDMTEEEQQFLQDFEHFIKVVQGGSFGFPLLTSGTIRDEANRWIGFEITNVTDEAYDFHVFPYSEEPSNPFHLSYAVDAYARIRKAENGDAVRDMLPASKTLPKLYLDNDCLQNCTNEIVGMTDSQFSTCKVYELYMLL